MALPAASPIQRDFRSWRGARTGVPIPSPLTVYDKTIDVLKSAVARSKLGNDDKLDPAPAGCASY
jgi:hypothetical protein